MREFYARRIKRIFPALIVVLAASYTFGWFALLADEYKQLGLHITGGAGFVSNFVLWNEAGYFDNTSDTKPLLHLWSLGIEEQFYIVWPLLLWAAYKARVNFLIVTLVIAAISFYFNISLIQSNTVAAFYFPHARFWELLAGSLLAWVALYRKAQVESINVGFANLCSLVGLLLLVFGFWYLDKDFRFPGYWAVIPVIGAVLVMLAGSNAWVNRVIFSNRIAVGFGLISFPLYLWHWPLLSFLRIVESETPGIYLRISAVLLSVVLAWFTFKLVEKPVRYGRQGKHKVPVLIVLMIALGGVGFYTFKYDGLGFRFPDIVQKLMSFKYDFSKDYRLGTCFLKAEQDFTEFDHCDIETVREGKTVLLWGDSHAAHLYPGYKAAYGKSFNIVQRTASGCPPIVNFENPARVHCKEINSGVFSFVINERPARVILAAAWTHYDLENLNNTIELLKKSGVDQIDLIGPVPQWLDTLPKQLYLYFNSSVPHYVPRRMNFGLNENFISVDEVLRKKASLHGINYISPKDILCDVNGCITMLGESSDTLIAWDYAHLTRIGSEFLVANFPTF